MYDNFIYPMFPTLDILFFTFKYFYVCFIIIHLIQDESTITIFFIHSQVASEINCYLWFSTMWHLGYLKFFEYFLRLY